MPDNHHPPDSHGQPPTVVVDALGRPVQATDASGRITRNVYDLDGRPASEPPPPDGPDDPFIVGE
jgi:YD repeat-containing protein